MTVRLRGHHLLCMLTYIGKGYSPAFVKNYDTIAGLLSRGDDIIIVNGPDDICQPLLCAGDCHCFNRSVFMRDKHALDAISDLLEITICAGAGFTLNAARLAFMRSAFAAGNIRKACKACEWSNLCTEISVAKNYADVIIMLK